ncbi:hypothetical protein MPF19_16605 [Polaribacter sp. Z014]|uniref:hypothetical protein n=1 Tax=Polaribacter sp. Z014 TaxID=2927126 RepID=UPI0020217BFA|nr:hypothetical protein [Polaribacter sp. Z014]MCL7765046.1 hypothetical protein [Polaribacter sp. Z014]
MTEKETIIKYIFEMNADALSLILDDNKSYMDVSKETFINKLKSKFSDLNNQGITQFAKVIKGYCAGGDQCKKKGCGGYLFLTEDNQSLNLIFEEENDIVIDIYRCSNFHSETPVLVKRVIFFCFKEYEKVNYVPSKRHLFLQSEIERIYKEFKEFSNDVTLIEDFCIWSDKVAVFYSDIQIFEKMNFISPYSLLGLISSNSYIKELCTLNPLAKKALEEYNNLDLSNKKELIKWVLQYEEDAVSYGDYEKVDNWQVNNLILHGCDESVVLDCKLYAETLQFNDTHERQYNLLFEEYRMTSAEYREELAKNENFQFDLRDFVKYRGIDISDESDF